MHGPFLPLLAVVAGLVSFASPCCLPLLPGYVSYISALPFDEVGEARGRRLALQASVLFVAGFTLVFTALGLTASLVGRSLLAHQNSLARLFGITVILLGLNTMGLLRIPILNREKRLDLARIPKGPAWALPVGMAFAIGWTPCIGPVLATILGVAAGTGQAGAGTALLVLYSLGLGLPFIALAVGFSRAQRSLGFLRRHGAGIERFAGLMLVAVGALLASGRWDPLFRSLQRWAAESGWPIF